MELLKTVWCAAVWLKLIFTLSRDVELMQSIIDILRLVKIPRTRGDGPACRIVTVMDFCFPAHAGMVPICAIFCGGLIHQGECHGAQRSGDPRCRSHA